MIFCKKIVITRLDGMKYTADNWPATASRRDKKTPHGCAPRDDFLRRVRRTLWFPSLEPTGVCVNRPDETIHIRSELVGLSYLCKRGRGFFVE